MIPRRWRLDIALGVLLLLDGLRVFMPSLITLFGQAGGTPAEYMGLFALAWFVVPVLVIPFARLVTPTTLALGLGAALGLARLALQATDGGQAQLYVASVTVAIGLSWLTATAMSDDDTQGAFIGVITGVAAATVVQVASNTVDLAWRPGLLPWAATAALVLGLWTTLWKRHRTRRKPNATTASAWWGIGPAVLLWGMLAANPGLATAVTAWPGWAAGAVITFTVTATVAVVAAPDRLAGHPLAPGIVLIASALAFPLATVTVDGVTGLHPWWTIIVAVAAAWATAACFGFAAARRDPNPRPIAAGIAQSVGMIAFVVLLFAYYAAYDLPLDNEWVPAVAATALAFLAWRGRAATHARTRIAPYSVWPIAAAVVAFAGGIATTPTAITVDAPADELRVVAYNVRMGYGLDGTLDLAEQADTIADLAPNVVVLSEIDRGWFLNGGHDGLAALADRLGMRYVWAPAADGVWGDAVLTNLPITSIANTPLVPGGPTGAQALSVGIDWDGTDVTVIATHLQPPPDWNDPGQVEQIAALAADAATRGPVVLAGDLNLEPDDEVWRILMDVGLVDAFAADRPFDTTSTPGEQIDHILTTPDLRPSDPANPPAPYSDHRPVAVSLTSA
ncbi:endonuclease/exonuclease/phosphatase family protein [Stackebrandtia soli]|uniref:endonuclease/exonuclease/phosphatase family protein n=1 Tax=Stackebrandtia soli TaxID=1892856 RepID=UPI0039EA759D